MRSKVKELELMGPLSRRQLQLDSRRGQPLPEPLRRQAEAFFAEDFSDVRLHVGPEPRRLGARAFTVGSHIYVNPEEYEPGSDEWLRLIGHELAHVVQQRSGRARNPHGHGVAVLNDPHLEAEADRRGLAFAESVSRQPPPPPEPLPLARAVTGGPPTRLSWRRPRP